jgi:hypothetical protein
MVFPGDSGWGWTVRPLEDEPPAWALRDNLPTAEQAKANIGAELLRREPVPGRAN